MPMQSFRSTSSRLLFLWLAFAASSTGMQITGYQAAANDRFASGFPVAPMRNVNPVFIGKAFDWTAVGWDSGDARQGYGFVSPRHHFTAKHFKTTNARRIYGNDNLIHSVNHQAIIDLGFGVNLTQTGPDLSVTRLASAIPSSASMPRYPVLDLNSSSKINTPSAYNTRGVFLYGHWGWDFETGSTRVASTTMSSVTVSETNHYFLTPRTSALLEGHDSGSPAFMVWTNPDGGQELSIIGNHVAVNDTNNFHNFAGTYEVMAGINGVMTPDGYALRVVGEPTNTWVGSSSILINNRRAWSPSSAPSDLFVTFNGTTAGNARQVSINANHNLRGLYFRNTGSSAMGFQFNGTSTLTIGRGGIYNLDGSRQVFEAPLALGDHQYWDAGAGGVSLRNVVTDGRLLNLRSAGPSVVRGTVSGSGGLALEGGQLLLEASSTYTGKTWVHDGELRVDGDISTSETLIFGPSGILTGHGKLPMMQGNGAVHPDGILTAASITPVSGISFHFNFSSNAPYYDAAATSPNDVLRLTQTPAVSAPLTAASSVSIYLATAPPTSATSLRGGFFFDEALTSPTLVTGATFQVFVADPAGVVTHDGETYTPLNRDWSISFAPEVATFAEGSINGTVMQLEIAPAAGTYDAWASSAFPEFVAEADRAIDVDPLHDGVPNLLAYALALDPLANKSGGMPSAVPGEKTLTFRFRRNLNAMDLTVVVESSENLSDWIDVLVSPSVVDPDVDGDGQAELLEVVIPAELNETRRFARLRVAFSVAP